MSWLDYVALSKADKNRILNIFVSEKQLRDDGANSLEQNLNPSSKITKMAQSQTEYGIGHVACMLISSALMLLKT